MPHKLLGPITPNIIRRKELTQYTRGIIFGKHSAGVTVTNIVRQLSLPDSTVRTIITNRNDDLNGKSNPRCGRLKITNDRDERTILRLARLNPKQAYKDLIC